MSHFPSVIPTLILILIWLLPPSVQANDQPQEERTAQLLKDVVERVEKFRASTGAYPSQTAGIAVIPELAHERRLDGWDRAFVYTFPGNHPPAAFDLFSAGADGVSYTGGSDPDDINNWDTSEPWKQFYASADLSDYRRFVLGGMILILAAFMAWRRAKLRRDDIEVLPPDQ